MIRVLLIEVTVPMFFGDLLFLEDIQDSNAEYPDVYRKQEIWEFPLVGGPQNAPKTRKGTLTFGKPPLCPQVRHGDVTQAKTEKNP